MVYEKGPKCKLQAGKTKRNKKQVSLTKLDTRNRKASKARIQEQKQNKSKQERHK